jgi:hypothetical protein
VSLALGITLTVAGAWFAAAFLDVHDSKLHALEHEPGVDVPACIGAPADWHLRTWYEGRGPGVHYDLVSECEWMGSKLGMSEYTKPNRTMLRMTVGFPLPCMQWASYKDDALPAGADKNPWYMGLYLPGKQLIGKRVERALPLQPVLLPATANVMVYAAAAFILITLVGEARAARRRRRGACVRCGYLANGLATCPECGAATAPARSGG